MFVFLKFHAAVKKQFTDTSPMLLRASSVTTSIDFSLLVLKN